MAGLRDAIVLVWFSLFDKDRGGELFRAGAGWCVSGVAVGRAERVCPLKAQLKD